MRKYSTVGYLSNGRVWGPQHEQKMLTGFLLGYEVSLVDANGGVVEQTTTDAAGRAHGQRRVQRADDCCICAPHR